MARVGFSVRAEQVSSTSRFVPSIIRVWVGDGIQGFIKIIISISLLHPVMISTAINGHLFHSFALLIAFCSRNPLNFLFLFPGNHGGSVSTDTFVRVNCT